MIRADIHWQRPTPLDQLYSFDRANPLYNLDKADKSKLLRGSLTALMIASSLGLNSIVRLLLGEKKTKSQAMDSSKRGALH